MRARCDPLEYGDWDSSKPSFMRLRTLLTQTHALTQGDNATAIRRLAHVVISNLNIQSFFAHEFGAGGDELEALLGLVAHELLDHLGDRRLLIAEDLNAEQRALRRIHRRFLELAGQHLAQALETRDLDLAAP